MNNQKGASSGAMGGLSVSAGGGDRLAVGLRFFSSEALRSRVAAELSLAGQSVASSKNGGSRQKQYVCRACPKTWWVRGTKQADNTWKISALATEHGSSCCMTSERSRVKEEVVRAPLADDLVETKRNISRLAVKRLTVENSGHASSVQTAPRAKRRCRGRWSSVLPAVERDRSSSVAAHEDVSKPQEPTLKDRFNKLGAGVGAAFGSIIQQDHGKAAAGGGVSKPETPGIAGEPGRELASGPAQVDTPNMPKTALEYFEEYEVTFTRRPGFSVVEGPGGKGAVVSWEGYKSGENASAAAGGGADGGLKAGVATDAAAPVVPPSGAFILAVAGESVADIKPEEVAKLLMAEGGEGQATHTATSAATDEEGAESVLSDAPVGAEGTDFKLVVRFREKTGPRAGSAANAGAYGGEMFRNRVKAMATGFGSLFQGREASMSAVREGSDAPGATSSPTGATSATVGFDAYILTFKAGSGTADDLPFMMTEMVGGGGVVVTGVKEDYSSALILPNEEGVFTAGTGSVGNQGGNSVHPELAPGAVLLRVAGKNVEGMNIDRVRKELDATAAEHLVVKVLFKRAPPIYRASVAAELTLEAANVPHIHVGTWQPMLKRRAGVTIGGGSGDADNGGGSVIGIGYGGEEWEDMRETMARAQRFVNGFRSVGIRVNVVSSETVLLPRNARSAYAGSFDGRFSSFQQGVRLWFSFPDEKTVSLKRHPDVDKLGLVAADTKGAGTLGSWITITAQDASPCAEAGVPVGENVLLTHVNGFDVSPMAYRSLAPVQTGEGNGWATTVLPALESGDGDTITLTFI